MHEEPPKFEEKIEVVPTPEEVQSVFEQLLEGKEYTSRRQLEDEKGIYLWDIIVSQEDGGHIEYSYMRKGRYEEGGEASSTAIHITFYDEEGMPEGGTSVAKLIDGKWRLTP